MSRTMSSSKSNEDDITSCFQTAREKLDRVDADAKEKKTQIVKDLAKDLEGKIRTNSICNEIVHQLHGKVSERLIRRCLDEKYKETHRIKNARKQKPNENNKDLAATVPLKQEKPKQQIGPMQNGKTVIMNDTSSDTEACPIPSNDVNELHDQSKRNGTGTSDNDEERTADADTKEESLTGEIEPVNKQNGDLIDRKENFVSITYEKTWMFYLNKLREWVTFSSKFRSSYTHIR
jgi:hypothetical protein